MSYEWLGVVLMIVVAGCSDSPSETAPVGSAGVGAAGVGAVRAGGAGAGGVAGATAQPGAAGGAAVAGRSAAGSSAGAAGIGAGAAGMPNAGAGAITAGADAGGMMAGAGAAGGVTAGAGAGGAGTGGADGAGDPSTDLWISPQGADTNPGTEAQPLLGLAAAVAKAKAGTTIWVGAGTYRSTETVAMSAAGEVMRPIRVFASGGERPVFDFGGQPKGDSGARGFSISGNYWHLRGIDVIQAGDNCIHISGAHNTIERVDTYGCSDTGIQITANSSDAGDPSRAAHNLVLNCDSHDNYDAANQGENADGFAAKLYIGPGNVFRGSRAWNNADDGWDLFASDDVVVIEDCWAIANGKIGATQNNTNGDGNGFKLGGAPRAGDQNMGGAVHEVRGSISIENRTCGFVLNNNSETPKLTMNGGRGDGRGMLCSLTNSGMLAVTMSAAEAIAAEREADGSLPPVR